MHTITNCPRCGKDFMYHTTDMHLFRIATDEQKNDLEPAPNVHDLQNEQPLTHIVICQECDEVENIAKNNGYPPLQP